MALKPIKQAASSPKEPASIQVNTNIKIRKNQHAALLQHIADRLVFANKPREKIVETFKVIDRELSGYVELSDDDKQRKKDTELGKGPKPYAMNLQFTEAHVDEIVTFLMSVLFPDDGMYKAIMEKTKQDLANGFTSLMNKHAAKFGHYRNLARAIRDMCVYNVGGNVPEWREIRGTVVENNESQSGPVIRTNEVVFEGNAIDVVDMYNFLWDVSVTEIVDLKEKGEFFALVEPMTSWRLKMMKQREEIFNLPKDIDMQGKPANGTRYYIAREELRHGNRTALGKNGGQPHSVNYYEALSGGQVTSLGNSHEMIHYYGWINPKDFGLSNEDEMQVWVISVLNSEHVLFATQVRNAHGQLPITLGMPWEDGFSLNTNSVAERLLPLQRFASHEMNVRQEGARKALYGLLFYDQNMIPVGEKIDLVAGQVPVKLPAQDRDIRKHINYINDQPQTGDTVKNIELSLEIMRQIQPTNNPQQVADLERATQYQAAALVQGTNRRGYKFAKIIDGQAFEPLREMQAKNILAFQPVMKLIDESGNEIEIIPSQLRGQNLEFAISEGMKGIDRMIVATAYKEIINMILQSSQQQNVDVLKLLDYYSSLLGDKVDFGQFKLQSPLDALPVEQKNAIFQQLQAAQAEQQQPQGPAQ